ncbi:MAG: carboxynorspermidine decarboxylase [Parcubacteria group bacterium Gr01-1014_8]|nr:MAG: carboxynorspermidine decarboxylase [Parcubacteria group bacterium Gr01-1014_8]
MKKRPASTLDPSKIKTAAFVIEEELLRHNLSILKHVKDETGCFMLQALKTWATWPLFHITKEYLDGTEVSSLNEARLGFDEFGSEVHMYAPAYKEEEFADVLKYCNTIVFNSFSQWYQFRERVWAHEKNTGMKIQCGLRINPEYLGPDEHGGLWSPCAPGSRLGIRINEFKEALAKDPKALEGISGLHFHIFFEKEFSELETAVTLVEEKFATYFPGMKWINFGGGQKITDDAYDVNGIIALIKTFQKKYDVRVQLEPGAAIVWNAGTLVASVLDVLYRDDVPYKIAVLDMSFSAHTPDFILSSDYDVRIRGAKIDRSETPKNTKNLYRLGGGTCLTGDRLSFNHVFKKPLKAGDKIVIEDGIQYNLVQCTMFNGVQHPSIVLWKDGQAIPIREFSYQDFRARMG